MNVPVSDQLSTKRGLVEVWIEETMDLDFDLSGEGEYVDTGAVEGRIQVDFELSRSELMDRLDRAESPSASDQLNMFLENWSASSMDTDEVELNYGRVLLQGAEPTELPSDIQLGSTFETEELRTTSPDDLTRELRKERTYETTYEELADDVAAYLEREGIVADPSFSAPVHIQATAIPSEYGTDFTITVENNEFVSIDGVQVEVEMPQGIGREASAGHQVDYDDDDPDSWTSEPAVTGNYDPEEGVFVFDVRSLSSAAEQGSERQIRFNVPAKARGTLDELSGEARFSREGPFSNIRPVAVFDAGGHRLTEDLGTVDSRGHIDAAFSTPIDAITVGSRAEIRKQFEVEGVTPIEAFTEIEKVVRDRGMEEAEFDSPSQTRDVREGKAKYEGEIRNGSVLVGDNRISIDVYVDGEVRSSERETSRDTDENLPAERRSITVEYGHTGVRVNGRGADQQAVNDYVTDLRDELQLSLRSISEAM